MEKKRKYFVALAQSLGLVCFTVIALASTSQKAVERVNGFREGFERSTGVSLTGECSDIEYLQIDSIYSSQPDLVLNDYSKNPK